MIRMLAAYSQLLRNVVISRTSITDGFANVVSLPPMSYPESVVMVTFVAMALLWVTRDPPGVLILKNTISLNSLSATLTCLQGWGWGLLFPRAQYITDGTVGVACAVFLLCMPATPPRCWSKLSSIGHSLSKILSHYCDHFTPCKMNVADTDTAMYSGLSNTSDSTHKIEHSSNPMLRNETTKSSSTLTIDTSPYRDVVKKNTPAEKKFNHGAAAVVNMSSKKMQVYYETGESIPPPKIDRGYFHPLLLQYAHPLTYICLYTYM